MLFTFEDRKALVEKLTIDDDANVGVIQNLQALDCVEDHAAIFLAARWLLFVDVSAYVVVVIIFVFVCGSHLLRLENICVDSWLIHLS